jgi:hypothetical protein
MSATGCAVIGAAGALGAITTDGMRLAGNVGTFAAGFGAETMAGVAVGGAASSACALPGTVNISGNSKAAVAQIPVRMPVLLISQPWEQSMKSRAKVKSGNCRHDQTI